MEVESQLEAAQPASLGLVSKVLLMAPGRHLGWSSQALTSSLHVAGGQSTSLLCRHLLLGQCLLEPQPLIHSLGQSSICPQEPGLLELKGLFCPWQM